MKEKDDLIRSLNNIRGKYIKQTLSNLEVLDKIDGDIRKVILDSFNDCMRDIYKILELE